MAELRLVLTLIVADNNHPRVASISTLLHCVWLLIPVQGTAILVDKLASILILVRRLVRLRRDSNVSRDRSVLINDSALVGDHLQVAIVGCILGAIRLQNDLPIVIRVTQFGDDLIVLVVA